MNLYKFQQFLIEARTPVQILVLDIVIDNEGNLYNGDAGFPIIKGHVVRDKNKKIIGIKGDDRKDYPAGIDKNGNLVPVDVSPTDVVLTLHDPEEEGEELEVPAYLKAKYPGKFPSDSWQVHNTADAGNPHIDYTFLIPLLATGWVNVKVDMEIVKRVRRYSKALGNNDEGIESLVNKLKDLQRISKGVRENQKGTAFERSRETIQKQMSAIILLHYINEVKNFFTPSSAGFLFESFMAGLIPNSGVVDTNTAADVVAEGKKYQIKLLSEISNAIPVTLDEVRAGGVLNKIPMDYYLIGFKYPEKITLHILQSSDPTKDNYYEKLLIPTRHGRVEPTNKEKKGALDFKADKIKALSKEFSFTIEILGIEEKIDRIAKGLNNSLNNIYGELSKFQYNIETIITGIDERGNIISGEAFTNCTKDAEKNIKIMTKQLSSLISVMNPARKGLYPS